MAVKLKCPHCNHEIEVSEVLKHQVEEQISGQLKEEFSRQLSRQKSQLEEELKTKLEKQSNLQIQELQKQLEEREQKYDEMVAQEVKLRREQRALEDSKKQLQLDVERKLDEQKKILEEQILKQASEEHRLKDMEREKVINDLKRSLDEARRRAQQGSQQLQGEVLELDLEATLRETFPDDEIEPVGKGVKGADVRQIVKGPKGFYCGVVLWETKRTKAWSDGWITKLKEDLRSESANIPVIVTSVMPSVVKNGMGLVEGVWVVDFTLIIPMATLLRKSLVDSGRERAVAQHKGTKADQLYQYIISHEFRQQVEAVLEVYQEMHVQIQKEKAAFERIWKLREGQLNKMVGSTAQVVGSIQGVVGQTALQIKGLDPLELGEGE